MAGGQASSCVQCSACIHTHHRAVRDRIFAGGASVRPGGETRDDALAGLSREAEGGGRKTRAASRLIYSQPPASALGIFTRSPRAKMLPLPSHAHAPNRAPCTCCPPQRHVCCAVPASSIHRIAYAALGRIAVEGLRVGRADSRDPVDLRPVRLGRLGLYRQGGADRGNERHRVPGIES